VEHYWAKKGTVTESIVESRSILPWSDDRVCLVLTVEIYNVLLVSETSCVMLTLLIRSTSSAGNAQTKSTETPLSTRTWLLRFGRSSCKVEQHGTYHKWQIRALELPISVEREFSVLSFRKTFQACAWCVCQCWALVVMDRMVIFFLVPAILTIKQDHKTCPDIVMKINSNIVDTAENWRSVFVPCTGGHASAFRLHWAALMLPHNRISTYIFSCIPHISTPLYHFYTWI
jgi:hypothetical protein